ncbi:MAG TPA: type II secretion system protein [Terriglobales bacterium]|nr:type II secretion system protein [Terriglobales bacterium]
MQSRRGSRGFTLIEMMVVISVILILLAVALPNYSASVNAAREENLRKDLNTLNQVIYQYTLDKQKAPKSLDDLRTAGYLDAVPDDITGRNDTWAVEEETDTIMSPSQTDTGIIGVHSGSNLIGSDGRAYSEW